MIGILTSTDRPAVIVLASDPSVEQVNDAAALAEYRRTSDADALTIPDDATEVVIRALSASELSRAEARAGRVDRKGQRLYVEAFKTAVAAGIVAASERPNDADARHDAVQAAHDAFVDGLDDDDALHLQRHEAWLDDRARAVCELAILEVKGIDLVADAQSRFPVGALEAGMTRWFAEQKIPRRGRAVISEIAAHVDNLGRLGKAGRSSSLTPSGEATSMPSRGSAPSASTAATRT